MHNSLEHISNSLKHRGLNQNYSLLIDLIETYYSNETYFCTIHQNFDIEHNMEY